MFPFDDVIMALTGLMGNDSFEEAQVNDVCDAFTDILDNIVKPYFTKSEEVLVSIWYYTT